MMFHTVDLLMTKAKVWLMSKHFILVSQSHNGFFDFHWHNFGPHVDKQQTLWYPEMGVTMYKHHCNVYMMKPKCMKIPFHKIRECALLPHCVIPNLKLWQIKTDLSQTFGWHCSYSEHHDSLDSDTFFVILVLSSRTLGLKGYNDNEVSLYLRVFSRGVTIDRYGSEN